MRFRPIPVAILAAPLALSLTAPPLAAQAPRRPMQVADIDGFRDVRDLDISPDGAWVAYAVGMADVARDKDEADIWLSNWAGTEHVRLTSSPSRESQPRFSPDGRWIAFVSSRKSGDRCNPASEPREYPVLLPWSGSVESPPTVRPERSSVSFGRSAVAHSRSGFSAQRPACSCKEKGRRPRSSASFRGSST